MTLIRARSLLSPTGLIDNGWVEIDGTRIRAWGQGEPLETAPDPGHAAPRTPDPGHAARSRSIHDCRGEHGFCNCAQNAGSQFPTVTIDGIVAPGFVDVHCHGGGGASFDGGPEQAATVLATHLRHGTTTMVASLVTADLPELESQVRALAPLVTDGSLAGIHLEGPWLSEQHKGAHAADLLRDPVVADIDRLLDAGGGAVRMVTIAPEKPGALAAIRHLASRGVTVAVGHTAADLDTAKAAIAAGARGATHLFNAMPDILHRAPGPGLALWHDPDVWVELICDGVHVHTDLIAQVMATKPDKTVLITDAMAAAAAADGDYVLGQLPVEVRQGVAHISGTTTVAGSTLTLSRAVRTAVAAGVGLETALLSATAHPADYLGLTDVGRLAPGTWADLVCLDDDLNVTQVMRHGQWVDSAE